MSNKHEIGLFYTLILFASLIVNNMVIGKVDTDNPNMQPNDPLFSEQEALFRKINVFDAWHVTKGDPNILIGVIDNGFDFFHPDIEGNLLPGFYASGGYHTECFETIGHGTAVASLIIAGNNNKIGMTGLAPACRVVTASYGSIENKFAKMQKKFRRENPDAGPKEFGKALSKYRTELKGFAAHWTQHICLSFAEAIRYLVDRNVKVINMSSLLKKSLCPPEAWEKLEDAFAYAKEKAVIIVVSSGDDGRLCEDYPGGPDTVIIVGSTLLDDSRWEEILDIKGSKIKQGSSFGKRLTVMAPTENLQVCGPHLEHVYTREDGPLGPTDADFNELGAYFVFPNGATSCAAPMVTSLGALVYSVRPDLDAETVVDIIKESCDDIGEKGFDIYTGYGRINFGKTIEIALKRYK